MIIVLYIHNGVEKDIIQRVGRLRQNGDKVGNVFIILTTGTQESMVSKRWWKIWMILQ